MKTLRPVPDPILHDPASVFLTCENPRSSFERGGLKKYTDIVKFITGFVSGGRLAAGTYCEVCEVMGKSLLRGCNPCEGRPIQCQTFDQKTSRVPRGDGGS